MAPTTILLRRIPAQGEHPGTRGQALAAGLPHVTIRLVSDDELTLDEAMPDGRAPLEIVEHRPGQSPYLHGTERGIAPHRLRPHARAVADRLGIAYVDPTGVVLQLLERAEAA